MIGPTYFGGVSILSSSDFIRINGFSNEYWGWGAEDDDLYRRLGLHQMTVTQPDPLELARYTMLSHKKAKPNPDRFKKLNEAKSRANADGLISLKYCRTQLELKHLYTHILVDIRPP